MSGTNDESIKKHVHKSLFTDNGREFNNRKVKQWTQVKGIIVDYAAPYHHEGRDEYKGQIGR